MQCGDGSLCCGQSFNFDFTGIDPTTLNFYAIGDTKIILVVFVKDGSLHLSISFDCGHTFEQYKKITELKGTLKDVQILASPEQFVIAIKESVEKQDYKRAISGKLNTNEKNYSFKECVTYSAKGQILNVALGFRKFEAQPDQCESVDYVFIRDGNTVSLECQGHGGCKPLV
jgi:hypothetical protein